MGDFMVFDEFKDVPTKFRHAGLTKPTSQRTSKTVKEQSLNTRTLVHRHDSDFS